MVTICKFTTGCILSFWAKCFSGLWEVYLCILLIFHFDFDFHFIFKANWFFLSAFVIPLHGPFFFFLKGLGLFYRFLAWCAGTCSAWLYGFQVLVICSAPSFRDFQPILIQSSKPFTCTLHGHDRANKRERAVNQ